MRKKSGSRKMCFVVATGWMKKNTESTTSDERCPNSNMWRVKTPRISWQGFRERIPTLESTAEKIPISVGTAEKIQI